MTVEEEKAFLARHLKATEAGEFVTIDALFQAYKKELGRSYTRDAFYQLLLLLVMDNAIWHKSSTLKIPTNIGFAFIPPYTPEMNPIEQVWKEIRKRGFKNKAF
ncbi:transposase family protein [Streptococcus pneumoniae]|nr:transposase family protein [Streptococcus pneumoniae]